mmetsp:Transcript_2766/g.7264  ORF Transcript_2766/g.7264 Transcript_2766/m.7264 type:complete len:80 (-) Transcript_2766:381-620(-)
MPSTTKKDESTTLKSSGDKKDDKKPEEEGELGLADLKRRPTKGERELGEMSVQDLGSLRPPADGEGAWGEQSTSGFNLE